ncbi:rna-directed dna polymerase from mobile element jockey-like [Limosa lapponica baueri]|uniref:Rna-directed dna polymerase from mobile element jockey-like n=1 Tax=Limosa lapponica baueri TaxID=1758121 RepID=A0A2I0TEL9_LIMLA|nr:rna-directed dna polymerase from mobile element jockey-like [Limosa lapponica baueri]
MANSLWCAPEVNTGAKTNLFTDNLDNRSEYTLSKFADDTKLGRIVGLPDTHATIQADVDSLEERTNWNLMKFKGKCQVLHLRRNNPKHWNRLWTNCLESSFA